MTLAWKSYTEFNWRYMSRPMLHFDTDDIGEGYVDLSWGEPGADPIWAIGAEFEGLPRWAIWLYGIWWRWRHPSCPEPGCSLLEHHSSTHVQILDRKTVREWT
jgi:hypothetical protein